MISKFGLSNSSESLHTRIAWVLLLSLLFLRIPFLGGARFLFPAAPTWIEAFFQVGTYLLTAFFIWWERDRWTEFHLDRWASLIIIVFKPLQTLLLAIWGLRGDAPLLAFPSGFSLLVWAIAIILGIRLCRSGLLKRSSFTMAGLRWFLVGAACGLLVAIVIGYLESFQLNVRSPGGYQPRAIDLFVQGLWGIPYQMGYAAVTEEPLFRGFLWGYLRKLGWKEPTIWLSQAGLFTLAHIYYLTRYPLSFWVLVPTGALVLGLLVWRSRTITSTLAAHAMMNAMSMLLGYVIRGLGF